TAYWYNPNIHPFAEHEARKESVIALTEKLEVSLHISPGYDIPTYFQVVVNHEDERCRHCFNLRLSATARMARQLGINAITSTLLISPHQEHELLRETGETAAAVEGVTFLYTDLRKRYSASRHITKPMKLYRQQYCGCLYSEWERFGAEPQS
ncbi:epoxyqueuosine reductase QueH, partial [Chloroflexota bacterium]